MRVKLLMVSAGAALVMTLTACGGPDTDAPADPPGITYDDSTSDDLTDDGLTGEGLTGEDGEQPYDGSTGEYEEPYTEPSYGVPEEYVPGGPDYDGVDDYPGQLSDEMYDNFQRNMGNYEGW